MPSTRRFVIIGAMLTVTASELALADPLPGKHPMESPQMQEMMRQHHPEGMMPMSAPHAGTAKSGYAGQQSRSIKALSDEDIAALQNGDGMGVAKAAELNGYPGPKHVLDLAQQLKLTDAQRAQVQAIFDRMSGVAKPLGAELVERERQLNKLFQKGEITPDRLAGETTAIGELQGRLRSVHLAAHLETRALLDSGQIALYQQLRGYGDAAAPMHHHHG
jgi:Spy/CpxP family protein refolding chaperone